MGAKSVAEKLGIKPHAAIWMSHAARLDLIGPLPEGVRLTDEATAGTSAFVFADDSGSLRGILDKNLDRLARSGAVWVVYPKANRTDVNRDTLWPILGESGLRPISQVAVDDVWSALRFRRVEEGEAPFAGGRQRRLAKRGIAGSIPAHVDFGRDRTTT